MPRREMTRTELVEAHKKLRKLVGGRAYKALIAGRPLREWRRSSPHNWFVEACPSAKYEFLWHSDDGYDRELPDLRLFSRGEERGSRIDPGLPRWIVGRDAGAHEERCFYLNPLPSAEEREELAND